MKLGNFTKQPSEKIFNSVTYDDALDDGDKVSTVVSCVAEPEGLEVTPSLVSDSRVRLLYSGGTDGVTYKVTLKVETAGGEAFEDEIICKVKAI